MLTIWDFGGKAAHKMLVKLTPGQISEFYVSDSLSNVERALVI